MHTNRLSATVKQMKTRPRPHKSRNKNRKRSPARAKSGRMARDYSRRTRVRGTILRSVTISRSERWEVHIRALGQYANRTGTSLVPTTHTEQVGARTVALGAWVAYNRQQKRKGMLSRERVDQLSGFVGWEWTKQRPGRRDNPERDARIISEYRDGESAQDLAEKYELSRQRVHQIVKKEKRR